MKIDKNDVWKKPVGAAFGGITEALLFHPLDSIKTHIQISKKHHTLIESLKSIYARNDVGILNFYRGLTPVTLNLSMKYIIRFSVNYRMREILSKGTGKTTNAQNFLAGLTAGTVEALVLVTPFDVIKTKMQTDSVGQYKNLCSSMKTIIKADGILGLWRGCIPTIIRQSSNQACMFTTYTFMRCKFFPEGDVGHKDAFLMGLFSSSVGPLMNTPVDTIKTRLQNQSKGNEHYASCRDALIKIYKYEGLKGYYKGLSMRLLRIAPGQGIIWFVVENFNKLCGKYGY